MYKLAARLTEWRSGSIPGGYPRKASPTVLGYTSQSRRQTVYAEPSFDELLALCLDFGIVSEARPSAEGFVIRILDERMELRGEHAAVLLKGLLLGYFFNHSRDDLSLAEWHA